MTFIVGIGIIVDYCFKNRLHSLSKDWNYVTPFEESLSKKLKMLIIASTFSN